VGRIQGFRRVPFNIRMPRQTSGASAGWVGQGAPKPVSKLQFDTVSMTWAKIAVIIALTEELVRYSSPSAEALVRQDMVDAISQFMDSQFLDPSVAASANVSPASLTYGVTGTASTGDTAALITADVKTLLQRFVAANHIIKNGVWVMNPRTALHLSLLRTLQDLQAFPGMTMTGGTFFGMPVLTTGAIDLDIAYGSPPSGESTNIYLIDAAEVMLADEGGVTLDVSREASLQMDDAPSSGAQSLVSLWQNNLIGLRAERYINWLKRRATAALFISGVQY
jgi:HK97 family phage major capsid protein